MAADGRAAGAQTGGGDLTGRPSVTQDQALTDPSIVRLNEQLKGVSSIFFNLGTATIGAAVACFALSGSVDWIGIGWLFGALVLTRLGAKVLGLLEVEV